MWERKTREEIQEEMFQALQTKTGINSTADGSMAKAFIDSFGDEIDNLYYVLEEIQKQAFLSTSYGMYLDLIGELLNTPRKENELDDEYRYRISQAVNVHAGGNKIAIEEKALSVMGVASIELRPYAFGTGSFIIYVYPEPGYGTKAMLYDVKNAVKSVVSEGIYFEVAMPTDIPVSLDIAIMFNNNISDMEKRDIRNKVKLNIETYLNSMAKNQTLYINEIISITMNTNDNIIDMGIVNLYIDGNSKYINNIFPKDNERFTVGKINVI